MTTTGERQNEPIHVRILKWLTDGSTGGLVPEIDPLSSQHGGYVENAAHSTDTTILAATTGIPAGKTFVMQNINITNEEAYNVLITVFDGPSASALIIDRFIVGAFATLGITELTGYEFVTSVIFQSLGQGAAAFVAGTSIRAGGVLRDT